MEVDEIIISMVRHHMESPRERRGEERRREEKGIVKTDRQTRENEGKRSANDASRIELAADHSGHVMLIWYSLVIGIKSFSILITHD